MAILNQTQLVAASNATYFDNTSGSITPTAVRTLNNDWISSSILAPATSSMSVASASFAGTASFALNFNPSATASYALQALNANNATLADTATFANNANTANSAITASFALNFNPSATASYALFAATASVLLGFVDSSSFATFATTAATASYANQFEVALGLTASGLNYPTTDGAFTGQVLQTNAAGTLSFGNVSTIYETIKNGEATQLTKGTVVYISGSQGDTPIVYRSNAADATKMPAAYILQENIAINATGRGVVLGQVTGIDVGTWVAGTQLWIDGLGALTNTRPTGSADIIQPFAVVTKTGNGGQINVLNPGPVLLPNIATGFTWVGGANNQAVTVATSSIVVDNAVNATSASYASNAELLDNLNFTAFVLTSSFVPFSSSVSDRLTAAPTLAGNNTFSGTNNFNVVSASYVNALSASIDYLYVLYQTSSIVYSSGSNQFGDAANDTQTLWGTVSVVTGPLNVTGSVNVTGVTTIGGELFVNSDLKVSKGGGGITSNIAIGSGSLNANTAASGQTAVGYGVLTNYQATGTGYNVGVGYLALSQLGAGGGFANTAVNNNVVVGGNSGIAITSGSRNTIVGSSAFQAANNTERNSGLGRGVLTALATPGSKYNTAIGHNAAFGLTSGSNNIIIVGGSVNGEGLTDGQNNTLIGMDTGVPTLLNNATVLGKGYAGTLINNSVVVTDGQGNIAFEKLGATGSLNIPSNLKITGSVNGNVTSASIASNTSSIDFSLGNFYTSLVSGSTNFNITNPKPGQTVNLLLSTVGVATASFSSNVKQVSGSAYTPTSGSGKNDILTFISFDGTSVYLANVKNLI